MKDDIVIAGIGMPRREPHQIRGTPPARIPTFNLSGTMNAHCSEIPFPVLPKISDEFLFFAGKNLFYQLFLFLCQFFRNLHHHLDQQVTAAV